MPIIRVDMMEGRTPEMKEEFIAAVCEATVRTLGVKAEQVRIIINELPKAHFSIAGKSVARREREEGK
jgi:4-oxalocrotonate tautomerase